MRKCLKIVIDINSGNCLKTRLCFENTTWAEIRELFQNMVMFENEIKIINN